MNKKLNNKGFSLVEIIVTLSISCVIVLAVYSFIFAGSNSYKSSNKQTTSQQEMSYINRLLGGKIKGGNNSTAKIIKASSGDCIYNNGNGYVFFYDNSEKSLFIFEESSVIASGTLNVKGILDETYNNKANLMSKYVDAFTMDFVSDDVEKDATGAIVLKTANASVSTTAVSLADGSSVDVTEYVPATNQVNVTYRVDYKGNIKNSNINYTIRNN